MGNCSYDKFINAIISNLKKIYKPEKSVIMNEKFILMHIKSCRGKNNK